MVLQWRDVTQAADGVDVSVCDQPVELLEDAQIPSLRSQQKVLNCGAAEEHSGIDDRKDQKRAPSKGQSEVNFQDVMRQLLATIKLPHRPF